jgi:hypothetical protein
MMPFINVVKDYAPVINLLLTTALFVVGYVLQSKARRIASLMAWKSYRDEIRSYAERAVDVLSDLEGLCEANPQILGQSFWNRRNELISKLSALRDYGKLLIPNLSPEQYGQHKSGAYQGYRQRALDCLTAAFKIASAIDFKQWRNNVDPVLISLPIDEKSYQLNKLWEGLGKLPKKVKPEGPRDDGKDETKGWSCKTGLVEAKRQFVTEVQSLIDPRLWIDEIGGMVPKSDA